MTEWVEPHEWKVNEVITASKLNTYRQGLLHLKEALDQGAVPFLTLSPLLEDPPLAPGRMWWRGDLGELRFSPDGQTILKVQLTPP